MNILKIVSLCLILSTLAYGQYAPKPTFLLNGADATSPTIPSISVGDDIDFTMLSDDGDEDLWRRQSIITDIKVYVVQEYQINGLWYSSLTSLSSTSVIVGNKLKWSLNPAYEVTKRGNGDQETVTLHIEIDWDDAMYRDYLFPPYQRWDIMSSESEHYTKSYTL